MTTADRFCRRCGERTPILVAGRCPRCAAEVAALLRSDERRRAPRFTEAKDLSGWRTA